jgi:mono/diheme cytochrome c family protein
VKGFILSAMSLVLALAGAAPALGKGTQAGVYSAEQASEGAQVYARRCAMCHGARLEGTVETPELVGKFVADWADRPLANLYDYLARAMPQNAPGSLSPQDNSRVIAYLLQANGAPAGRSPLPTDPAALRRLSFDPVKRMGGRARD